MPIPSPANTSNLKGPSSSTSRFLALGRKGRSHFTHYALTTGLLLLAAFFMTNVVMYGGLYLVGGLTGERTGIWFGVDLTQIDLSGINLWILTLVDVARHGVGLVALWIGLRYVHKRSIWSVVAAGRFVSGRRVLLAGSVWIALLVATTGIAYAFNPDAYSLDRVTTMAPYVALSLVIIPVQAGTEELVFRGYYLQGFAGWGQGWVAVLASSLAFALIHSFGSAAAFYGWPLAMLYYTSFGALLAFITLADEGTEIAMGAHIGHNMFVFAAVLVGVPVMRLDEGWGIVAWLCLALVFTALMRWRYGWTYARLRRVLGPTGPASGLHVSSNDEGGAGGMVECEPPRK